MDALAPALDRHGELAGELVAALRDAPVNDWSRHGERISEGRALARRARLEGLRARAGQAFEALRSDLEDVLEDRPGHPTARAGLLRLHEDRARWLESDRAEDEAVHALAAARRYGSTALADASLLLTTVPAQAEVRLQRYVPRVDAPFDLVPVPLDSPYTPLELEALEPGSYLLHLRRPGARHETRVPLLALRGEDVVLRELELPPDEEFDCGEDLGEWVWIPPVRFLAGGDPRATRSEERAYRSTGGFFVQKHEMTFGQYRPFVADLLERGIECVSDSARGTWPAGLPLHVPREATLQGPRWTADEIRAGTERTYFEDDRAAHSLAPVDALHFVTWLDDRARAKGSVWTYALPTGDEWEHAARGADGRSYPWGEAFSWEWTRGGGTPLLKGRGIDRHLAPGCFPVDCSPYGLVDVAGNVREVCADYDEELRLYLVRGGEESFYHEDQFRLAGRTGAMEAEVNWDYGFRLVRRRR